VRPFNFKMVVKYLSRETAVYEKRFGLPRRTNGEVVQYELRDGFVYFLKRNGDASGIVLSRWDIPDGAVSMEFLKMRIGNEDVVGAPTYYDSGGNLLKIGNR